MRRIAPWLLGCLLCLLAALPAIAAATPADCLRPGQEALGRRDLAQAAKLFADCAQAHPQQAEPQYWLGMAHFLAHQPQQAIPAFQRCLKLNPQHVQAQAMLGKLYSFDRDKLVEARELLSQALAQRPDLEDARFDLARVHALQGRYDQSFQEFNHLFQSELRFALYHTELGKVLLSLGLKPQARQEFQRALVLQPNFPPARKLLEELGQPATPGTGQVDTQGFWQAIQHALRFQDNFAPARQLPEELGQPAAPAPAPAK